MTGKLFPSHDTTTKARLLSLNIELVAIDSIIDNLDRLESSAPFIDEYLGDVLVTARNTCKRDVSELLEKVLLEYIKTIERALTDKDLPSADVKLELINQVKTRIGTYCSKNITDAIDEVQKKHSTSLVSITNEYANKPITDYNTALLDDLITSFQKNGENNTKYKIAAQTIQEQVTRTFKAAIEDLKTTIDEDEREEKKRNIEYAIETLPEKMKGPLLS